MKGGLLGGGYITPIGVMRFHFKSAKGLKNLDTVGKSDPYARVLLSGIQKGRTVTFKNNLDPNWDEVCYVPVHSQREKLVIEVMDEENVGKDRTLGQMEVAASDYIQQGEDGEYLIHDSKDQVISAQLRIGSSQPKGTLNFTVAFYPTLNVVDPEEEEREEAQTSMDGSLRPSADGTPVTPGTPNGPQHSRNATATTIGSTKSANGDMAKALAKNEREQTETDELKMPEVPKIRIEKDDLAKYGKLALFCIHSVHILT
jgi:hypothetical protein